MNASIDLYSSISLFNNIKKTQKLDYIFIYIDFYSTRKTKKKKIIIKRIFISFFFLLLTQKQKFTNCQ